MPTLQFKNCRQINAKNYKKLSKIQLQQVEISTLLSFAKKYMTAEEIFEDFLEESNDENNNNRVMELWDVVALRAPEKVLYECWVSSDSVNVFFVGTTKDTQVAAMCQWSFHDHTLDGSNEQLCDDLEEAFDKKDKK